MRRPFDEHDPSEDTGVRAKLLTPEAMAQHDLPASGIVVAIFNREPADLRCVMLLR